MVTRQSVAHRKRNCHTILGLVARIRIQPNRILSVFKISITLWNGRFENGSTEWGTAKYERKNSRLTAESYGKLIIADILRCDSLRSICACILNTDMSR